MQAETSFVYEIETEVADFNEAGVLKPGAYPRLFAQLAERHLNRYGLNVDETLKHGLAWALVSVAIEVDKPLDKNFSLRARTWYSQRRGPYFRRELVFEDAQGQRLFHGSTFSVLLDVEKRSVYRKKELPFELTPPVEEFTMEAVPGRKLEVPFSQTGIRQVSNSDLDCLGHVNNCRYGEYAYDALSAEKCAEFAGLKGLELYFISELRRGDTFRLMRGCGDKTVYIRGENCASGDTAFDVSFRF